MAESIRAFENSLRDFLINAQSDSYNTHGKVEYKYNNLKVYMDPKKIFCSSLLGFCKYFCCMLSA